MSDPAAMYARPETLSLGSIRRGTPAGHNRLAEYSGVPAVAPVTAKGRNAVRSYEAALPVYPVKTARPRRSIGRVPAHSDRSKSPTPHPAPTARHSESAVLS